MKRWGSIVAVLVAVALVAPFMTGCESDSDTSGSVTLPGGLVATWTLQSATATSAALPGGSLTVNVSQMAALGFGGVAVSATFHADGTVTGTYQDEDGTQESFAGTWSTSGDQLTITEPDGTTVLTYSLSGNTLTLSAADTIDGTAATITLNFTK